MGELTQKEIRFLEEKYGRRIIVSLPPVWREKLVGGNVVPIATIKFKLAGINYWHEYVRV